MCSNSLVGKAEKPSAFIPLPEKFLKLLPRWHDDKVVKVKLNFGILKTA